MRNVFKEDFNFSGGVLKPDDPAARSPTLRAGGGREARSTSAADHLATRGHQQRGHVPRRAIVAVDPYGDGRHDDLTKSLAYRTTELIILSESTLLSKQVVIIIPSLTASDLLRQNNFQNILLI